MWLDHKKGLKKTKAKLKANLASNSETIIFDCASCASSAEWERDREREREREEARELKKEGLEATTTQWAT